jgi:hypothetical protein
MILALFMIGIGLVIFAQLVDKYARLTRRGVPNAEPGEERASTLRDTLFTLGRGAAANNRATPRIPSSLRYLLWPVLILIALVGVALVSQGFHWYLHGQKFYDQASEIDPLGFLYLFLQYELIPLFLVLLGGLLLTVGVPLALAMRLGSWHVARDVFRYLLRSGVSLMVTYTLCPCAFCVRSACASVIRL